MLSTNYNVGMYDLIIFDLDGTIINSEKGIYDCLKYAFKKNGISYNGSYKKFIGPPFTYSLPLYVGADSALTDKLTADYREEYNRGGVYECVLYKGIKPLMKALFDSGKTIALATSKPEYFAQKILQKKRIAKYFTCVSGATFDGKTAAKDWVLSKVLNSVNCSNPVLIGDTVFDCNGAKAKNIDCIGVTYGFGLKKDLLHAGAVKTVDTVKQLQNLLLNE